MTGSRNENTKTSESWNNILHAKPTLTKEQAKAMLETITKIRKESGYRNISSLLIVSVASPFSLVANLIILDLGLIFLTF